MTINDLELASLLAELHPFAPKIHTLYHIRTYMDNLAAQGRANLSSASSATAVGPILWDLNFIARTHKIYFSVQQISGVKNKMEDVASRLTHTNQQDVFATFGTLILVEKSLEAAHPSVRVQVTADFHAAQQALLYGFSATVFQKYSTAWCQWQRLCKWPEIPADLQGVSDNIPFLHIFAKHVRASLLSTSRIPIKKRSVEQYLCSIGQIFSAVGASDPRHKKLGNLNFRLGRKLATYAKQESPPTRVRPIPVSFLQSFDST